MASSVLINDEYGWSASSGLFEWVLDYLLTAVEDAATRQTIQQARDHQFGSINLTQLTPTGRQQVLDALRSGLVPAAETSTELVADPPTRRRVIGHVKVLKLMADDVTRTETLSRLC
jgi:hypothetical protein